jgi:hypothetical protein
MDEYDVFSLPNGSITGILVYTKSAYMTTLYRLGASFMFYVLTNLIM